MLNPINISIIPPINSAYPLKISPTLLPTNTPTAHTKNVIIHIIEAAGTISTLKNAKLIPTAKKYGVNICLENLQAVNEKDEIVPGICADYNEAIYLVDTLNAEAGENE